MSHKLKISRRMLFIICIVLVGIILIPIGYAYFVTTGEIRGSGEVYRPEFRPSIVRDGDNDVYLEDSITNNYSHLAPGAEGQFKIELDLSDVGANAYYKIEYDRTQVPDNLKFYINKEKTVEFDSIEGVYLASNTNRIVEHIIYWKWDIVDTPEANENDTEYMNNYLYIVTHNYVAESFQEREVVLVNDLENPTGRISLGNTSGTFNMKLDFSRFSDNKSYAVYFDTVDAGDIHLYSDAGYQHEITSLSGTYTGSNTVINTPVYWRCEGTCSNGGLYYIVHLS